MALCDGEQSAKNVSVNVTESGDEALAKPNLIFLDINMPGMDGLEQCKVIRNHIVCPILFLTARITEQDKVNGLWAGGEDYITKPFGLQELIARIEAHLRRDERNRRPPEVVTSQGLIINLSDRKVFWNEQELSFSKWEFDIIEFLSSNPNQGFDKERIYEAVWGYDADIIGNIIYYAVGVILTFCFKDNRAFCKYICPITIFLKPMSYFSLLRIKCDESKCISCGKCKKVCPMEVDITDSSRNRKNGTECYSLF